MVTGPQHAEVSGGVDHGCEVKSLPPLEAVEILGCSDGSFGATGPATRRKGLRAVLDRRLGRASAGRVPADRIARVFDQYRTHYRGWNVKHFHEDLQKRHGFR
jgi:hypothetical protein